MAGLLCGARTLQPRKTRCVHCAQTGRAKSVFDGRYAPCCKVLCASTPPTGNRRSSLRIAGSMRGEGGGAGLGRLQAAVVTPMRSEACGARSRERTARSGGAGGRARSAHQKLTSRSLSERSGHRPRSEFCAAPRTEHRSEPLAQSGAPVPGRISCPRFFGRNQRRWVGRRAETRHLEPAEAFNQALNTARCRACLRAKRQAPGQTCMFMMSV